MQPLLRGAGHVSVTSLLAYNQGSCTIHSGVCYVQSGVACFIVAVP